MKVIIGRFIGGISLNGVEYLLENGKPKEFDDKSMAVAFLRSSGFSDLDDDELEDMFIFEELPTEQEVGVTRVLFLDDFNGHATKDPHVHLIDIEGKVTEEMMIEVEVTQRFSRDKINEVLTKLGIKYKQVSQGVKSEYSKVPVDFEFKLKSVNY